MALNDCIGKSIRCLNMLVKIKAAAKGGRLIRAPLVPRLNRTSTIDSSMFKSSRILAYRFVNCFRITGRSSTDPAIFINLKEKTKWICKWCTYDLCNILCSTIGKIRKQSNNERDKIFKSAQDSCVFESIIKLYNL